MNIPSGKYYVQEFFYETQRIIHIHQENRPSLSFPKWNELATVPPKAQYKEKRDIVINDNTPFTYMKRESHKISQKFPKIYQLRWNSWLCDNSLTVRAIINAVQYISGHYEVQEFFYKPGSQDYFDILVTAKATIQDPYALKACEYKLTYFENFEVKLNVGVKELLKFTFEDKSKLSAWISAVFYWAKPGSESLRLFINA
ncbi:20042_t:CDS:2 [Dentiscutata erythropus]|uniref:20042_t:CDS:1 n=1 Tax=Dentiscutata erythropus TaxID=1348616 RepID=A0A9N8ZNQ8_9GLOM|nr:20042_t:CDS:2 [Dentiscutata erythropus]